MKQELNIEENENQKRVIKKLRPTDWLFIVLPMIFAVILLVVVPIAWSIIMRASGNPTEIGGFNYDGLVIIAGIVLCGIFCAGYFLLAFILSLLTCRNRNFRVLLISGALLLVMIFCGGIYYSLIPPKVNWDEPGNQNSEYWEKSALRFVKENHTILKHEKKA